MCNNSVPLFFGVHRCISTTLAAFSPALFFSLQFVFTWAGTNAAVALGCAPSKKHIKTSKEVKPNSGLVHFWWGHDPTSIWPNRWKNCTFLDQTSDCSQLSCAPWTLEKRNVLLSSLLEVLLDFFSLLIVTKSKSSSGKTSPTMPQQHVLLFCLWPGP